MAVATWTTQRVLVIAKTYPELSSKYLETVCTAAITELGQPLRLYPIPFRYLRGPQRFKRYQWITAALRKSDHDSRPESYSVEQHSIVLHEEIAATPDEWGRRAEHVLKAQAWQQTSMREVLRLQQEKGTSLVFVRPKEITNVSIRRRDANDAITFAQKLAALRDLNLAKRMQMDLFESTVPAPMKSLEYVDARICVEWRCTDPDCIGHTMQILDWEVCELSRKRGPEAAKEKVGALLTSGVYNSALILGNIHMYPASFAIIGLWYPKRDARLF